MTSEPAMSTEQLRDVIERFEMAAKRMSEKTGCKPLDTYRDGQREAYFDAARVLRDALAAPVVGGASLAALQQRIVELEHRLTWTEQWAQGGYVPVPGNLECGIPSKGLADAHRQLAEVTRDREEATAEVRRLQIARIGDSENIGREMSRAEAAEATIARVRALSEKWLRRYTASLEYDKQHGLRDITTQLGGMAMAAEELDAALAAPAAGKLESPGCSACADGECPTHLGTPSHLGAAGTPEQAAPPAVDYLTMSPLDPRYASPEAQIARLEHMIAYVRAHPPDEQGLVPWLQARIDSVRAAAGTEPTAPAADPHE